MTIKNESFVFQNSVATQRRKLISIATPSQRSRWADRLGVCLSALCIVHCVLTPVLLILLPTVQFFFLREEFHAYMAVIIPLTCLAAFVPGYRSHGDKKIFWWASAGLALIISALFVPHTNTAIWYESILSVAGGACLIRAHILNRYLCACCHSGHQH